MVDIEKILNDEIKALESKLFKLENKLLYCCSFYSKYFINLWWKYIHKIVEEFASSGFLSDKTIDEKYSYIIQNTVIQPLGNCGESGTNICYFFRQSNDLSKEMFNMQNGDNYKYLVLIDDATVSGHQAVENLEKYKDINDKEKYILTFILFYNISNIVCKKIKNVIQYVY